MVLRAKKLHQGQNRWNSFRSICPGHQQVQSPTGRIQEGRSLAKYAPKRSYEVEILPHVKFGGQPWHWYQEDRPGLSPLASVSPLQPGMACLHNPRKQVPNNAVFKHAFETHNPESWSKKTTGLSRSVMVSRGLSRSPTVSHDLSLHLWTSFCSWVTEVVAMPAAGPFVTAATMSSDE